MGRPRGQEGTLRVVGERVRRWRGEWFCYERGPDGRELRRHKTRVLGLCPDQDEARLETADRRLRTLTENEARRELKRLIAVTVAPPEVELAKPPATFGWFWRHRWLPLREGRWRARTRTVVLLILEGHVGLRWDTVLLPEIDPVEVAAWLNSLAKRYSHSLVDKCRTYLRSILAEAVEQEYLRKSPVRRVALPETRPEERRLYAESVVRAIRAEIPTRRDRLILDLQVLCGLRPGELFALRWDDMVGSDLRIDEAVVEGVVGKTKTPASRARVALPSALATELSWWRAESQPAEERCWIFPGKTGKPIWRRMWMRRVLKPAAERAGIEGATLHAFRRTFATLAHDLGVPLKVVQQQLRHASVVTTGDIYVQPVEASQREAVEKVAAKLLDTERGLRHTSKHGEPRIESAVGGKEQKAAGEA